MAQEPGRFQLVFLPMNSRSLTSLHSNLPKDWKEVSFGNMSNNNCRERFKLIASKFIERFPELKLNEPPNFRQYLYDWNQHRVSSGEDPFFTATLSGEMCDDHLLYAGLSELRFPQNFARAPPFVELYITGIAFGKLQGTEKWDKEFYWETFSRCSRTELDYRFFLEFTLGAARLLIRREQDWQSVLGRQLENFGRQQSSMFCLRYFKYSMSSERMESE